MRMRVPIDHYAFIDLDAPTLPAFQGNGEDHSVRWLVWCRHCRVWHEHGPGEGHRIAHCGQPTPYTQTGYNLALRGAWPS
jgi:hypothetical protein